MKMKEFLELSDDHKCDVLYETGGNYSKATEDSGKCSLCGNEADAGDYCFGCHKLICLDCEDAESHLSNCLYKLETQCSREDTREKTEKHASNFGEI
jgi:hypothetical protein